METGLTVKAEIRTKNWTIVKKSYIYKKFVQSAREVHYNLFDSWCDLNSIFIFRSYYVPAGW